MGNPGQDILSKALVYSQEEITQLFIDGINLIILKNRVVINIPEIEITP
jgi:hypothetical protein